MSSCQCLALGHKSESPASHCSSYTSYTFFGTYSYTKTMPIHSPSVESSMLLLAGLCMLIYVANILHFLCRRTLASPLALSPTQILWGLLGFLSAVTCATSSFASLWTVGFDKKSRIITASLWVNFWQVLNE